MTDRERAFAELGLEYAEGIEQCSVVTVPATGREVRRKIVDGLLVSKWEAQPWNDNYWKEFDDLLDAVRFGMPPSKRGK